MTLIEIMVVVAIISMIMAAVGVVAWRRYIDAQVTLTRKTVHTVQQALGQWVITHREPCPPDLAALREERILDREPKDAWGELLRMRCPAERDPGAVADVWSKGPDGIDGNEDDICSSKEEQRGRR